MSNLTARFFRFFKYLNIGVISEVIRRSGQHRLFGLSAEIAYNAVFALFPAILVVLTAIGLLNIPESEFRHFTHQVSGVIPNEAMILIQKVLPQLSIARTRGLFSLSFLAAIWVSSSVLGAAMAALDQIHQIPRDRVRPFWKAKLVSIGLSLGTFLLLVIALLVIFIGDVSVTVVAQRSGTMAPSLFRYWHLLSLPIALGIVALSLGFIYRFGTSRWRKGTPIMPGAILAALLWAVLSGLLRFYVSRFGYYNQAYGAIGAAIILLLWLYLSAFAMLLGSELNVVVGDAMRQKSRQREGLVN
ncbi:MAG: YihY/virulence factor BrkB family protein [Myxacorys californica WJT36-NPBG1]|nr:YihY/virulence factor BrkB family protein [Myxacorys californica WJT36-NPBG1]